MSPNKCFKHGFTKELLNEISGFASANMTTH